MFYVQFNEFIFLIWCFLESWVLFAIRNVQLQSAWLERVDCTIFVNGLVLELIKCIIPFTRSIIWECALLRQIVRDKESWSLLKVLALIAQGMDPNWRVIPGPCTLQCWAVRVLDERVECMILVSCFSSLHLLSNQMCTCNMIDWEECAITECTWGQHSRFFLSCTCLSCMDSRCSIFLAYFQNKIRFDLETTE